MINIENSINYWIITEKNAISKCVSNPKYYYQILEPLNNFVTWSNAAVPMWHASINVATAMNPTDMKNRCPWFSKIIEEFSGEAANLCIKHAIINL